MTREEWIKKLEGGIQTSFGVNNWGSCQYSGALDFFNTFLEIRKDLSLDNTLEVLGCKFFYSKINNLNEVKRQMIKDSIERIYEDIEDDWYAVQMESEKMSRIAQSGRAEDLFDALRKSAWDLWSAAPHISYLFFGDIELKSEKAPGEGPILNQEFQSTNYEVGLHCAMLVENKIIKDPQSAFADFDT